MNLSELNPHIRYCRLHKTHLENSIEFSICYDCRLFYSVNAEGKVVVDDKEYNISKGMVLFFPPKTKYRFTFTNTENFQIIIMDFDLINDFAHLKTSLGTASEKNFLPEKVIEYKINELFSAAIIKQLPQLSTSLTQCTENFLHKGSFYREKSSALLKLCLLELVGNTLKNTTYSKLCENVVKFIYENYASHELSNAAIAEEFNYHQYHLNYIVKEETGKSLHKHLIDTRLNVAKNYLLTTSYTVEQISWKCGFSSTSYFIKAFKETVGMTPNKYRKIRFHTEL